jgi:hypothetical protein
MLSALVTLASSVHKQNKHIVQLHRHARPPALPHRDKLSPQLLSPDVNPQERERAHVSSPQTRLYHLMILINKRVGVF